MRATILLALLGACGGKQPSGPATANNEPASGSAQTPGAAGGATKVPEGKTLLCTDAKDELRAFELWDSGDFELRNGQVAITGSYQLAASRLAFTPDPSKDWAQYSGLDTKELAVNADLTQIGVFKCGWIGE
jgi:hypothetical protein